LNKEKFFSDSLKESAELKFKIEKECKSSVIKAIEVLARAFSVGKKLLLCGNGGSAADCQHIATEFMIRLNRNITRPALPAIAITTDPSNLTASGNDIGWENGFARSIDGLGNDGDILLAISTSGNSINVITAVKKAHEKKMVIIGLLGNDGGELKRYVDIPIVVPSSNVQRIQEGHITISHIICEAVETELFSK
jgi:D-sedoheptulose 7-phosphate isomerase